MLILVNLDAPREDIEKIKSKIKEQHCSPHEIPGERNLAIGITGPTDKLRREDYFVLPSVVDVVRVTKKFKLVGRQMKAEDTIIDFDGIKVGGKELAIFAGPCSVEDRDSMFRIAESLKKLGIQFIRGGAYKPRSSPYSFQGLKEEGLKILDEIKSQFDLKIITEILNPRNIDEVASVTDIMQIGARNMQNFALLEEVGATGIPVLLKRGMAATIEDLLLSAEYITNTNNFNIMLCERGIRTFEQMTRNTLDLNAVPVIKKNSHLPIIVDPSHGIGIAEKVPSMALASIAAGADGIIIEVHDKPESAWSDGHQTISIDALEKLINKIKQLAPIVDKELNINGKV